MALVQKLKVSDHMTFGQIADAALSRVLQEGGNSKRIDVVFDVYNEISIKSAEREQRGEGESVTYKNLTAGQKIKQFNNFLLNGQNNNSLIKFFNDYWSKPSSRHKLADKELYITCGAKCYKVTVNSVQDVVELSSEQREADTRLLLHAKHAAKQLLFHPRTRTCACYAFRLRMQSLFPFFSDAFRSTMPGISISAR